MKQTGNKQAKCAKKIKNRDYDLVKEGKFNMRAIMQRAIVYMRNYPMCYTDMGQALHQSWNDAKVSMKDYKNSLRPLQPKKGLRMSDLYCTTDMQMGYATK